jgi:hypothetical protein
LSDVVVTLRVLVEICLCALIGQGVLSVLPGVDREKNLFYLILKTIASPGWRVARWVSPRSIKETFEPPKDYRYPFMEAE